MHLGHYDDEYVRTPEGWQFASRTMHMLYRGAMDPGVVTPLPPRGPQLLPVTRRRCLLVHEYRLDIGHDLPRFVKQLLVRLADDITDELGEAVRPHRAVASQPAIQGPLGDLHRAGFRAVEVRGHVGVDEAGKDDGHSCSVAPEFFAHGERQHKTRGLAGAVNRRAPRQCHRPDGQHEYHACPRRPKHRAEACTNRNGPKKLTSRTSRKVASSSPPSTGPWQVNPAFEISRSMSVRSSAAAVTSC